MDEYVENEVYEFVLLAEILIGTTEELYTNKGIFYACLVCSKEKEKYESKVMVIIFNLLRFYLLFECNLRDSMLTR